jgi:nucleotide-binding universal stress UspA family protein
MKHILVPTDFSDFSDFAFDAAIKLALKFGAEIHCLHKAELPSDWKVLQNLSETQKKELDNKLEKLQALKSIAKNHSISCHINICGDSLLPGIKQYVDDNKVDFLVIGSHGASGKKEYFIGSNAQKITRSIHRPILIIKEKLVSLNFKEVIYASGFNENDKMAYASFLKFIRPFHSEIHLLAVNTSSFFSQPSLILYEAMKDFIKMSDPLVCKRHFYNDISVDAGVRHFSESYGADLIVISYHVRHPVKRMFQGSNVELLVNHADIPVLTIDFP